MCIRDSSYSQRDGLSYQALVMNPFGEEIPGYNNLSNPLLDQLICLKFSIIDSNGSEEYSESQSVITDGYGMVNLTVGNGEKLKGYANTWKDIIWGPESKELKVYLDVKGSCENFVEISNQFLSSVPFAMFAASAGSVKSGLTEEEKKTKKWINAVDKIKELKNLMDSGIITKKEYEKSSKNLKKIILKF